MSNVTVNSHFFNLPYCAKAVLLHRQTIVSLAMLLYYKQPLNSS